MNHAGDSATEDQITKAPQSLKALHRQNATPKVAKSQWTQKNQLALIKSNCPP